MMYQNEKFKMLEKEYGDCKIHLMHNEAEKSELATQVAEITNGVLHYGNFKHEDGFLINELTKTVIVLPEKSLEEQALMKKVTKDFDFNPKKINFIIKKSSADINYLVRENGHEGDIEFNNKTYAVFSENASASGDNDNVYLLKKENIKLETKRECKTKRSIKP